MKQNHSFQQKSKTRKFCKTSWTYAEDTLLLNLMTRYGNNNWQIIAKEIPNRNGKQCRERYLNHLCPTINHDEWRDHEYVVLLQQHELRGNNWSFISTFLPVRSANHAKNSFYILMKRKQKFILSQMI
jgi:myb proto-oncogene protein